MPSGRFCTRSPAIPDLFDTEIAEGADRLVSLSGYFYVGRIGPRLRNRLAMLRHAFKMKSNRLLHLPLNLFASYACRNTPVEIRRVRGGARSSLLHDNQIFFHRFSPACFKMLFGVPGPRSSFGFPGTVTRPVLIDCLN